MEVSRRSAIASLLAGSACCCSQAWAGSSARLMVVTASAGGPHAAVVEGIERAFAARSITPTIFQLPAADAAFREELKSGNNQLAIAVGLDALRALALAKPPIRILATMSFRADLKNSGVLGAPESMFAGVVLLDLAVAQIVASLRTVFPDASRIAVFRNPAQPDLQPDGNVRVVDCAGPSDLLPALRKLRGVADFVICLPDSTLYNKTTVEPLLLASLEHRIPLVGFSASFVRAGAAVGVYPDFADLGRQTAALAERYISGSSPFHEEYPRRTVASVNERVLHLLGRSFRGREDGDVVVVR